MHHARFRPGQIDNGFCKFCYRELVRIADIDEADDLVLALHEPDEPVDQVVDIAERTRLRAIAINGDVTPKQHLDNEVRYHPPVVRVHARTIGIEDPRHLDAKPVLAPIVEE